MNGRQMFLTFSQIGLYRNGFDNEKIQFYRLYLSRFLSLCQSVFVMLPYTATNNKRQLIRNQLQEAIISYFMFCFCFFFFSSFLQRNELRFSVCACFLIQIIPGLDNKQLIRLKYITDHQCWPFKLLQYNFQYKNISKEKKKVFFIIICGHGTVGQLLHIVDVRCVCNLYKSIQQIILT